MVKSDMWVYDLGEEPVEEFVVKHMGKGISLAVERGVWMEKRLQIEAVLDVCDAILKQIDALQRKLAKKAEKALIMGFVR